jgi:hypothetical protein
MNFQLTSLKYSQGTPTKFLKFEYYDIAISEVSHYGFLRGHSSVN